MESPYALVDYNLPSENFNGLLLKNQKEPGGHNTCLPEYKK
jgi:hypothetical protein